MSYSGLPPWGGRDLTDESVGMESSQPNTEGPSHYHKLNPQPWDVVAAWKMSYLAGSVLKYLARYPLKGQALEDLKKARHFLDKLIEMESKNERSN